MLQILLSKMVKMANLQQQQLLKTQMEATQ